ncbi:MAG: hypothetical protein KTR21_12660 [Rhodobacteraceae bacterium]|nr:hypothetical protein [Paracoccaceae bacterium]
MTPTPATDRLTGATLFVVTVCVIADEWGAGAAPRLIAEIATALLMLQLSLFVEPSRQLFVVIGIALIAIAAVTQAAWLTHLRGALDSAAFITAFFTALTSLRHAALRSRSIAASGRFLADQPPGRRYVALTVGGQLFGLLLSYSAVSLLGSLAEMGAREETNPERRARRVRRMLLAVQRGFVSTLPWSPLAFAVAISTTLIPGASWAAALGPCLVSAALLVSIGWAMDYLEKPRAAPAARPTQTSGSWLTVWPLLALLACLGASAIAVQSVLDIRIVAIVMVTAPLISLAWMAFQYGKTTPLFNALGGGRDYILEEAPKFRGEILLLGMAGFIGALGAGTLQPVIAAADIDPGRLSATAILLAWVWTIPLAGQIGMNPILIVSLIAPLTPSPAALGADPTDFIVAITAGWALSGATSPFTATTLMVGAIGKVSAREVGLRWNGTYLLVSGAALSGWVALYHAL